MVNAVSQRADKVTISKYCFQNKSALAHKLWEAADSFWNLYFQNCGRISSLRYLIILLTDHILSPSTNFGWPKQGQNCPAANFRPKGVCSPMYTRLFTFYGPSQYLSSFPSWWPKSKKIAFFTHFSCCPPKNFLPIASLISMPSTFHIASLNRYTSKFSGIAQRLI